MAEDNPFDVKENVYMHYLSKGGGTLGVNNGKVCTLYFDLLDLSFHSFFIARYFYHNHIAFTTRILYKIAL